MRALIALLWLLHWLPLPILGRIGAAVGSLMYLAIPKRRRIALTNLRLCMPELSEQERRRIAHQHFQDYARSILERAILWWAPIRPSTGSGSQCSSHSNAINALMPLPRFPARPRPAGACSGCSSRSTAPGSARSAAPSRG